ncbi:MAG: NAD(P)-binding domain-containing protein [Clostridiales bacterium]|nr:NAD(P)-binding domain-containing protein [Clostridiales bacterium]HOA84421.1 pyrroline-5-carboxylate reductase dimerization domain-containing protein [Bacillota bacterium]
MKLGLLGYGNLASAIDAGIAKVGMIPAGDIYVCDSSEAAQTRARAAGHRVCGSIAELFLSCEVVFILIKPKIFRELSPELAALDTKGRRVVSCMATVPLGELREVFRCPVMRIMPTLASAGAADIIGHTQSRDFDDILSILGKLGDLFCLDEDYLDRLTVASSCGLGFAARIMEVYAGECEKLGFSQNEAEAITRRIFTYAAGGGFAELAARVATKGGVTEAGLFAMDKDLRAALSAAFTSALEKTTPPKH